MTGEGKEDKVEHSLACEGFHHKQMSSNSTIRKA